MTEIWGKLIKSNTLLKFRCVKFRSALFHLHELLQGFEEVHEDEIRPNEITHSNLSKVFDLINFPHISIILSDSIQIYLFNIYIYIYIQKLKPSTICYVNR